MRCKLCNDVRRKVPKNNICWSKYQICGQCLFSIKHERSIGQPRTKQTICDYCGKTLQIAQYNKYGYCSNSHRAKYYRLMVKNEQLLKTIKKYSELWISACI